MTFIQTWLCLDLLQSCLNRNIDMDDFTMITSDGRRIWTNRGLEKYLQLFEIDCQGLDEKSRADTFDAALDLINDAVAIADVIDSYCECQTPNRCRVL